MALYPLRMGPLYKRYLWGGRRFESVLGRPLEPGDDYAESWEVADHPAGTSLVAEGPMAGLELGELVRRHGADLLGKHHPQARFPLLLKYLDARQRLSVQVHPDDELAAAMGYSDPGKTEAWVVLDAEPNSRLWAGFRHPMTPEALQRAVESGDWQPCLHEVEPRPGDCFFLPAGTVHALGEGLLVAEIQVTSDLTFRLHDWNRVGTDGKPRALHIAQGLRAARLDWGPVRPRPPTPVAEGVERLAECGRFVLQRRTVAGGQRLETDDRCHILTGVAGQAIVRCDGQDRPLGLGETLLLPASLGSVELLQTGDPAVLLEAFAP